MLKTLEPCPENCGYELPHYHCPICKTIVLSDSPQCEFHPCCSENHIIAWNNRMLSQMCREDIP